MLTLPPIAAFLLDVAREAEAVIADLLKKPLEVYPKIDGSFATNADLAAERVIVARLETAYPQIAIVAEETRNKPTIEPLERFFAIDPIDGTRGFARGSKSWTVNIGLVENGVATAGVVTAPALGTAFVASDDQAFEVRGAEVVAVHGASAATGSRIALISHSADELATAMLAACGVGTWQKVSSSLKFGLLARGEAHVYARGHTIMVWDTAAGHAVVNAAGGHVVKQDGTPLLYSSTDLVNPPFVAWSSILGASS